MSSLTDATTTSPLRGRLFRAATYLATTLVLASTSQASETVLTADDIAPFRVTYSVGNNLVTAGNASLELNELDGDIWQFQLETNPTGVFKLTGKGNVSETSILRFEPAPDDGFLLRSESYSYRQDNEKRRAVDAAFNWKSKTLAWTRRGESDTASLAEEPVLDRLSVSLAVMSALRKGETEVEFLVFDSGRLKNVIFTVSGEEQLETSLGTLDTLRVERNNAKGSSRTTVTWFAPSLDYMPVKIEQLKRGGLVARLTLKSLTYRDIKVDEPLITPEGQESAGEDAAQTEEINE